MLRRSSSAVRLIGLLAFEAAAVVALHALASVPGIAIDWSDLGTWLSETPPEDAVVAIVRVVALGLAYWLAATTALYLIARLAGVPALLRGVGWATLSPVRRLVDGLVVTSIVAVSNVSGPALVAAQEAPPVVGTHAYVPVPADDGEPTYTPTPSGDPAPTTPAPQQAEEVGHAVARESAPDTHVVVAGDNLWKIAETRLAAVTGRPVDELRLADVHAYWLRLIDANVASLASGDPNLIYPGEVLTLPPVTVE